MPPGPDDYRRFVLPAMRQIFSRAHARRTGDQLRYRQSRVAAAVGRGGRKRDWHRLARRLARAWERVGHHRAVQGNMDPLVLLSEPEVIRERVGEVLDQAGGRPGHIFNLGHGVVQQTPVENAIACVEAVHELSAR
ncbi:MAG: uroporphyrinogen decarboxylase family protein [Pirellulaceae bacterium]